MAKSKKRQGLTGQNDANITPLADVTTTLIVVFLITMPALMWNGFQVNQSEAGSENAVVTPTEVEDEDLLTIEVEPDGILLNGDMVTVDALASTLSEELATRSDKTVVISPNDAVVLGRVVEVLDIAKASGAESLAMLNRVGE